MTRRKSVSLFGPEAINTPPAHPLMADVREFHAMIHTACPDSTPAHPQSATLSKGADSVRMLYEMGYDKEQITSVLQWALEQDFWRVKIHYVHTLTTHLAGEPITLFEALARAKASQRPSPTHDDDAMLPTLLGALRCDVNERGQQLVLDFWRQVCADYRLLCKHYARIGYQFKGMCPTPKAYLRLYIGYYHEKLPSLYNFIQHGYREFIETHLPFVSHKQLLRWRSREQD